MINIDLNKAIEMYINEHKSMKEIASSFGTSYSTIYWLLKSNSTTRSRGGHNRLNIDKELIKERYLSGKTCNDIAKEFNIGHTSAVRIISSFGIQRNSGARPIVWVEADINNIRKLYVDDKLSITEVCDITGFGYKAVLCLLHDLGISRSQSEAEKVLWCRKEFRNYNIGRIMSGGRNKKNCEEARLEKIIDSSFVYNGSHGKVVIDGFAPDFINENKKKIIQYMGCYWHHCKLCGKENSILPNGRSSVDTADTDNRAMIAYNKEGYEVLLVWGHELGGKELMNRLKSFYEEIFPLEPTKLLYI